jgi:hypothetical protein
MFLVTLQASDFLNFNFAYNHFFATPPCLRLIKTPQGCNSCFQQAKMDDVIGNQNKDYPPGTHPV